ncbi:type VI secretion IcmF C-terminal domain-containing protein [Pyxidicoccus sp. MSG2]|uniref:type VI secretion IcmF C-terminal domain-containing protein n=1 Tax=Pyxidicoccus sp. MSG2 TaxID=2996790 RepID=UPI00226DE4B8|nr:type VI secretion IcmF C-terminal domain-containing protein [Pyxidicoccus sp. MSG2]MCY1022797.1 hypothetical protein [Pyxidicoccus sp. MSG2]
MAGAGDKVTAATGAAVETAEAARPYLTWVLVGLAVLLAVALVVAIVWWWRKRRREAPAREPRRTLESRRLLRIRQRFLGALPWRYRVAVRDFPTVVVLGPAGSGKSRLIDLEVDWRRQERQFMPSHTSDPLLQCFLGADRVVQELSSSLLEDDSREARSALRKLWKATFRRQRALVVIALDARWLAESPPDEVRRITQLVRGKLNLLTEVCKASVETRLCLTHMDAMEGFADFARLLRTHGAPLQWDVPPPGEEARLASGLQPMEQYFALGLVSLSVESFGRLEEFYARGGESFAALARFVTGLSEGGALSFPPKLTHVYLSSPEPEARSAGALTFRQEQKAPELRARYLGVHLRRCAALLALGCLPVLAAYGVFRLRLDSAEAAMADFDATVTHLEEQHLTPSGEVVEGKARATMNAMATLWSTKSYWPPLEDSFTPEMTGLRGRMARGIRLAHLKPLLERCQQECSRCGALIPGCAPAESTLSPERLVPDDCEREKLCQPEQMLHLLAVVRASRNDDLGNHILSSLNAKHHRRWGWATDALGVRLSEGHASEAGAWVQATGLREEAVGDYIISSDVPWLVAAEQQPDTAWLRWPYAWLEVDSYLNPWTAHLRRLQTVLSAREVDLEQWDALEVERRRLHAVLTRSAVYTSTRELLALIDTSRAPENQGTLKNVGSIPQALDWLHKHRADLMEVLRLEEDIGTGLEAVETMTTAQLLTRTDGLFLPGEGDARIEVRMPQQAFEFRPREVSRMLLEKLIRQREAGRWPFPRRASKGLPAGAVSSASDIGLGLAEADAQPGRTGDSLALPRPTGRLGFDTDLKPLVDEFTLRMADTKLSQAEAAQRQAYVLRKVGNFARQYRQDLLVRYREQRFTAGALTLASQLSALSQPASELTTMLREVADGAGIGPLQSPYYAPLRQELAMFSPIVQLMTPDKDGQTAQLVPYLLLVSQLQAELGGSAASPPTAAKAGPGAAVPEGGGTQLVDLISPLGRVALSMMLEDEGSYLARVDAWLDKQGLLGELRRPFREPFVLTRELGRAELERVLAEQWDEQRQRTLEPLLRRYPFNVESSQELDPEELDVLRRGDGAFWQFVAQVLTPVVEEKGTEWMLRRPLRQQLSVPPRMLLMLSRLSRLSRALWDDEGKPKPLPLQVRPLPLPATGASGFVTMSFLKCGAAAAFGFNQTPAWQEFPLSWWEPKTASVGAELRTPGSETRRYRSTELSRSSWNCFRLLDEASFDAEQNAAWPLPGPEATVATELSLRFGMRGGPWTVFREVVR